MLTLLSLSAILCTPAMIAPQSAVPSQIGPVRPARPAARAPIFRDRSATALPFAPGLFGRGVCATDVDRDGRVDFVIAAACGASDPVAT